MLSAFCLSKLSKKRSLIVDDKKPALHYLRTLNYGKYGIFLVMGNAGLISSTVSLGMYGRLESPL